MIDSPVGAVPAREGRCRFSVWAPGLSEVALHLVEPRDRLVPLERGPDGTWSGVVEGVQPGALYFFRLDGQHDRPDPASRHQPRGVHGPSAVVDPSYDWTDDRFKAVGLEHAVVYEMHVGTFSEAGTFEGAIAHLDELRELGVTHVELLPVAQFPGRRNWGYDGVYPWAVQDSYGGPRGLQRFVDACHARDLAVVLDVVYNHLGPEGNYLAQFAPYFNGRYHTPWGDALNFDGEWSDKVREYFIGSALYFAREHHVDAFRIDAIHAIFDMSARPFLQELTRELHALGARTGRRVEVIAESDLNDARVLMPAELGGFGMDAQWSDDFHHAQHALLTGERAGYYDDFGDLEDMATCLRQGYLYTGQYSRFRRRRHGNSPHGLGGRRFVVCTQNHDQVGNRARGDRPSTSLTHAQQKLQAALLLLSPYVPMLFMGQEYGETAPFQYFTSHTDPALAEAVRKGRRQEFVAFGWKPEDVPDPQDEATFRRSRLQRDLRGKPEHRALWELHRELLALRRARPALADLAPERTAVNTYPNDRLVLARRWSEGDEVAIAFAFAGEPREPVIALPAGRWRRLLDTEEQRWQGRGGAAPAELHSDGTLRLPLAASSCAVYARVS